MFLLIYFPVGSMTRMHVLVNHWNAMDRARLLLPGFDLPTQATRPSRTNVFCPEAAGYI
jgi:hypothetical protein